MNFHPFRPKDDPSQDRPDAIRNVTIVIFSMVAGALFFVLIAVIVDMNSEAGIRDQAILGFAYFGSIVGLIASMLALLSEQEDRLE